MIIEKTNKNFTLVTEVIKALGEIDKNTKNENKTNDLKNGNSVKKSK